MAKDLFNRYIWLIDTVYSAKRITFAEINQLWVRSLLNEYGERLPLRTFHNHREAIDNVFGITIACDRSGGRNAYYIENITDIESDKVRSWLLNVFSVHNIIIESQQIKQRILLESIPSGQHFSHIIKAMKDGRILNICHQGYSKSCPNYFDVEPYCLKLFKQRWYLLARSLSYEDLRVYALDRILKIDISESKFQMPEDFESESYFHDAFGIIVDEDYDVEYVRVRASSKQRQYIRSLPLHHSQIEIEIAEEYSVFQYFMRATVDFKQELLSRGSDVEVLEPQWLRDCFCSEIAQMKLNYNE